MRLTSKLMVSTLVLVLWMGQESAAQFKVPPIRRPPPIIRPNQMIPLISPISPILTPLRPLPKIDTPRPRGRPPGGPGGGSRRSSSPPIVPFDEDKYLSDVKTSMQILEHLEDGFVIIFSADSKLRVKAMRDLLRDLAIQQINTIATKAQKVLVAQKSGKEAELYRVEDSLLGVFRWQTKGELRRNIQAIKQTETEVKNLSRQSRRNARRNVSNWSPSSGWQSRGRIRTSLGHAYGQLNRISISGWGG